MVHSQWAQKMYNIAWNKAAQKLNEWTAEKTGEIEELRSVLSEAHYAINRFCHSKRLYQDIDYAKFDTFLQALRDFLPKCKDVYPGVFETYEVGVIMIERYGLDGQRLQPFWFHAIERSEQRNREMVADSDTILMTVPEFYKHRGYKEDDEETQRLFRDVIAFGEEFVRKVADDNDGVIESLELLFSENESLLKRVAIHCCVEERLFHPIYPIFLNGSVYIDLIGPHPVVAEGYTSLVQNDVNRLKDILKAKESGEMVQKGSDKRDDLKRKRVEDLDRDKDMVKLVKVVHGESMDEMDLD
ncbi:Protein of unknown function [Pyronema omphalodes CBS 100304]|uniref:Uncharacterized protein n=1 Tax=Pyronema omphalodes (strain CBS 100304) TaxID=1076935 RepID=U4KXQ5_PYROM|nr:Protein of unknown function [Pyronema omphalodes CBS 100304]